MKIIIRDHSNAGAYLTRKEIVLIPECANDKKRLEKLFDPILENAGLMHQEGGKLFIYLEVSPDR